MNITTKILYFIDRLFKRSNLDNGLIVKRPKLKDWKVEGSKNFETIVGATRKILALDSNYEDSLPPGELQKRNGNETMSCVSQSACNAIEVIINRLMKMVVNKTATEEQKMIVRVFKALGLIERNEDGNAYCNTSDRYIAYLSRTTQRGNTQIKVADTIRKYGLVAEIDWPFVDGWNNYYTEIPSLIKNKGFALLDYIQFNYEWVYPYKINEYEKYGPNQLIGYAWPNNIKNGIYQSSNLPANHAFLGIGYTYGLYDLIFDSYEPFKKKLSWNYINNYGMLYTVSLRDSKDIKKSLVKKYENQGIKITSSDKVYIIRNDERRWLSTKEMAQSYNIAMKNVKTVPDIVFDYIPEGEKMINISNGIAYDVVTELLNER